MVVASGYFSHLGPKSTQRSAVFFSKSYYSSHSMAEKKMNFAKHYEGFCYPSKTVSLQVQFGSNVSPSRHGFTS